MRHRHLAPRGSRLASSRALRLPAPEDRAREAHSGSLSTSAPSVIAWPARFRGTPMSPGLNDTITALPPTSIVTPSLPDDVIPVAAPSIVRTCRKRLLPPVVVF